MNNRDNLLVLAALGLVASAALLARRSGAGLADPLLSAALSLLAFGVSLAAWARWVQLGSHVLRARALVLNGAASLLAATLWLEFVLDELWGIHSPLRWTLAIALAWMSAPFIALALTRLARRRGR